MRANLRTLIEVAREHHEATASNGKWHAWKQDDGSVEVWHYSTLMISVREDNRVVRHSYGHNSMSDKCDITRIKWGVFSANDYDPAVYEDEIGATR